MGRRKTEERLSFRASAFYFSITVIFIGKLSWSLCGGKSSHFGWLDLIGLNICNKIRGAANKLVLNYQNSYWAPRLMRKKK